MLAVMSSNDVNMVVMECASLRTASVSMYVCFCFVLRDERSDVVGQNKRERRTEVSFIDLFCIHSHFPFVYFLFQVGRYSTVAGTACQECHVSFLLCLFSCFYLMKPI